MTEPVLPPLFSKSNVYSSTYGYTPDWLLRGEDLSTPGVRVYLPDSLPEADEIIRLAQASRASIAELVLKTSLSDVERSLYPSVLDSRRECRTRYMSFVTSAPLLGRRLPKILPKISPPKLGPEDCYQCQLKMDHSECERHKYIRIGGGYRHSYEFLREVIEAIEAEERKAAKAMIRKYEEEEARKAAEAAAAAARLALPKRRVQTFVRTKSGKLRKKYHYFTEDEYKDFKKDDSKARVMLGLGEGEELEDWVSSKKKFVQDDKGNFVKAPKNKNREGRRHRDESDSESDDNLDDKDKKRKHRRRRRHSSSEDDSYGSDGSDGRRGGRHRRGRRGGKSKHRDGSRRGGRHRRHRYNDSDSDDSRSSSEDSRGGHRRRRGGRGRRRRDYSDDEEDGGHGRRRRRRHRYSDEESGSDGSDRRSGDRRRRRRRRRSSDDYSDSEDEDGEHRRGRGGERRRRHRRRRRSYSDSGSDDEGGKGGRRRRRRRHYSDDSDDSEGKGRDRGRRRRRRRYSSESDDDYSSDESGHRKGKKGRSKRRHGRGRKGKGRRRRRGRDDSDSYDSYDSYDSESDSDDRRKGGKSKKRGGRRKHYSSDSYDDESSDSSAVSRRGRRKGKGRRADDRRGKRGRRRESYYSDEDSDSDRRGRRKRGGDREGKRGRGRRRRRSSTTISSTSSSSVVSAASDASSVHSSELSSIHGNYSKEEKRRLMEEKKRQKMKEKEEQKQRIKDEKRKASREAKRSEKRSERDVQKMEKRERRERRRERRERRGKYDSTDASDASRVRSGDVSDVKSDDISSIEGDMDEKTKKRLKEEKKQQKKKEKIQFAQRKKDVEKRKERRRRRVSPASEASSVHSSEVSEIEGDFTDEQKRRLMANKKKMAKKEKQRQKQLKKEQGRRERGDSSDDSYARGKRDFYDMPEEKIRTAVKYGKGSSRFKDSDGKWFDGDDKKRDRKNKRRGGDGTEIMDDDDVAIITTKDGRKVRVSKNRFSNWDMEGLQKGMMKIRIKADGTITRDSDDSDAETIIIDEHGVAMTSSGQVLDVAFMKDDECSIASAASAPTPTDGGRIKLHGTKKIMNAFRKDKEGVLKAHLQRVLETASELGDDKITTENVDERASTIDYLSHYRLVEKKQVDPYARAFVVEDEDKDCLLNSEELQTTLEGIPGLKEVKEKQILYAMKVLDIDEHTKISFKMFAVLSSICDRVCNLDPYGQSLLDKTDLMDLERKMSLYKAMFYCNSSSYRDNNFITADSLRIDLIAGGLNRLQEQYVMSKLKPNEFKEISFLDYMAFIPLFLSMHENIVDNPLDMAEKYNEKREGDVQRDLVTLGAPLRREFLSDSLFPANTGPKNPHRLPGFVERGELLSTKFSYRKLPSI